MSDKDNDILFKLIIQGINNLTDSTRNIDHRLDSVDKTLDRNTVSLEEHMKRTDLLEAQLAPIRSAYDWLIISGKVIGILALLVTIIGGLFKTVEFLTGVMK